MSNKQHNDTSNDNEIYSLLTEKNSASFFVSGHLLSDPQSTERVVSVFSWAVFLAHY
jgi:hypothetical protein